MSSYFKLVLLVVLGLFSTAATDANQTKVVLSASNVLVMDAEFTEQSVAKIALEARRLNSELRTGKPLYLVMLSPGGSIDAGIELIDNLNALGRPVHTISLFAASMAFQTVQGLDTRYVTSNGTLMSHKARGQFQGEFPGQLDSRYQYYLRRIGRLDQRTVARSGGKLTLASYQAAYANEMWCDGQDCVDRGVADEVATVVCDRTLDGTKEVAETASFLGVPIALHVVKASCPTITGALSVKASIGGSGKIVNVNDFNAVFQASGLSYDDAHRLQTFLQEKVQSYTQLDKNHVERY